MKNRNDLIERWVVFNDLTKNRNDLIEHWVVFRFNLGGLQQSDEEHE